MKNKGFTLVELLVVVAIVSLLASIVLVSLGGARKRAITTKGLQFSASIYHSIGIEAVGIWDFNENTDNTCQGSVVPYDDICDASGNNNNGQRLNVAWSTNTPSGKGYSLNFNGSNYIDLGNPSSLRITGNQTIEMWLYPTSFSTRRNPYAKAYGGEGTITQETNGSVNYYYGACGGNCSPYQTFTMDNRISLNTWVHLVLVRDLSKMKLYWYKNGELVKEANAIYASATTSSNSATIGRGYAGYYAGLIDDLRIYKKALTSAEIEKLYTEGVLEHLAKQ